MAIQDIRNQYLQEDGFDKEYILDLIQSGAMPGGGFLGFLKNQQTQAPTYDYGSYVIPASDPTYTSGFNYARTIAGGMPFEDVVAPGMSFSPEQPGGYTQADLNVVNLPRDVAPVFPEAPTKGEVYQPSEPMMPYAPTGTPMPEKFIPSAQKFFPDVLPNFFGQLPQFDFSNIDFSKIEIPEDVTKSLRESLSIPEIDVSQFVTREELPSFVPSFEMPQIPQIDTSKFIGREELPALLKDIPQVDTSRFVSREEIPSLLPSIPQIDTSKFLSREDISGLRSDILGSLPQIRMPDTSQFVTQQDINKAIAGIPKQPQIDVQALRSDILGSLPQPKLPDVSKFVTQADINRAISGIPQISLSDIEARLAALESAPVPTVPSYNLPKPLGFFS